LLHVILAITHSESTYSFPPNFNLPNAQHKFGAAMRENSNHLITLAQIGIMYHNEGKYGLTILQHYYTTYLK